MVRCRAGRSGRALSTALADAYSAAGDGWQTGPGRVYDRLAEVLLARSPLPLAGCRVLDVGAGTGAVSRAAVSAGAAAVVALDAAFGMLAQQSRRRPPAVVGDVLALPLAPSSFDAAVAAFSLNHLVDAAEGLSEMKRVTRRGGVVVAASYGAGDDHPVKTAVEEALAARGWKPDPWYVHIRDETSKRFATVEQGEAIAGAAGLDAHVELLRVPFPELTGPELVSWRLGLAQHAPFVSSLAPAERKALISDALARLGTGFPPLVRPIVAVAALRP